MFELESAESRLFEFKVGNREFSIPLMDSLPLVDMMELSAAAEAGGIESLKGFVSIFERHAKGAVDMLNVEQFKKLVTAWREACSVELGE